MKLLTLDLGTKYQKLSASVIKLTNFHDASAVGAYVGSNLGQIASSQFDNVVFGHADYLMMLFYLFSHLFELFGHEEKADQVEEIFVDSREDRLMLYRRVIR